MKRIFIQIVVAAGLYYIIAMLWTMAEVKLYGWTQPSAIDSFAAWTIAFGAADVLVELSGVTK